MNLMAVLKRRIALLLKDKEETVMTAAVANSWLSNEAASFQAISRAGTFRLYFLTNVTVCYFVTLYAVEVFKLYSTLSVFK